MTNAKIEELRKTHRLETLHARPWVTGCHADDDGDCTWEGCPQLLDGEPGATGRGCPRYRDRRDDDDTDTPKAPPPDIDDQRDDARVIVYGDASPVTDAELRCARLLWASFAHLPLMIDTRSASGARATAGTDPSSMTSAVRENRAAAVIALTRILVVEARGTIDREASRALDDEERAEALKAEARRHAERAARLRAMVDACTGDILPDGPPGIIAPMPDPSGGA